MKKIITLFTFCLALFSFAQAQTTPQAFNYSAVARNAAGQPIATASIGIQVSILKNSTSGAVQYSENHAVTTDAFGLFNLTIGGGAVQSGSMTTINWGADNYFLKIGMDATGGANYLTMGTTQLVSVPYALHAGNGVQRISLTGDTLFLSNGQFFVAKSSGGGTGTLVMPTITTNAVTGITSNGATYGGNIANANGNQIIERGIVFSTSPNPTINSNKIIRGAGIGAFDTISAYNYDYPHLLSSNTTYYVRAYAVTENNISAYGNEVSFKTLSVGETGPGGGIVFFNKGNNTNGWQYLEAAPSDQSTGKAWGCYGTSISGTQKTVGSGENNTALIVAGCSDTNFPAKICDNLVLGGQSDWFLPSIDELNLMYNNLQKNGLGNFNTQAAYWSSTEFSANYAWAFSFDYGNAYNLNKSSTTYVRAVRAY